MIDCRLAQPKDQKEINQLLSIIAHITCMGCMFLKVDNLFNDH